MERYRQFKKNINIIHIYVKEIHIRCMLTAQIAFNYINKMDNNKIKNILVDYELSVWNDSVYVNEYIFDT